MKHSLEGRMCIFLSILMVGFSLQGMNPNAPTLDTKKAPSYINVPYLVTKLGAFFMSFMSDEDSSEESEDQAHNSALCERHLVTTIIEALRLEKLPLTIGTKQTTLEKVCDPKALKAWLHTLYKTSYESEAWYTRTLVRKLFRDALQWDALKNILDPQMYEKINTLLTTTDALKAEQYYFLFELLAELLGFPFATEVNTDELVTICKGLAHHKIPSAEQILACFSLKNDPVNNSNYSGIKAALGFLRFITEQRKDKEGAHKQLADLYLSLPR